MYVNVASFVRQHLLCVRQCRKLLLCNLEYVPCKSTTTFRAEILRLSQVILDKHSALFASALAVGFDAVYLEPRVHMIEYALNSNGTFDPLPYVENLLIATVQVVTHAQELAVSPIEAFTYSNPALNFLIDNADPYSGIFKAYNDTLTVSWNGLTNSLNAAVVSQAIGITVALCIVIALAVFASVVPILFLVGQCVVCATLCCLLSAAIIVL